jgi:hypothetical protein
VIMLHLYLQHNLCTYVIILLLRPTEVGRVHCIDMEKQELHIISTLNTLGCIDFNVPYNLNCLEERFSKESGLQCFS